MTGSGGDPVNANVSVTLLGHGVLDARLRGHDGKRIEESDPPELQHDLRAFPRKRESNMLGSGSL
jgi:hypothetical protein